MRSKRGIKLGFAVLLIALMMAVNAVSVSAFIDIQEQSITLESAKVGVPYHQEADVTGKIPPEIKLDDKVYTISNVKIMGVVLEEGQGELPPGLMYSYTQTSAAFKGTPTKSGTYTFKVNVFVSAKVNGMTGMLPVPVRVTIVVEPGDQIVTPPSSATILGNTQFTAGDPLEYTCTATGDNLSYIWYTKASGASEWSKAYEGKTFRLSSLTTYDNGMKIKCVVTNDGGSITSNEATIIVKEVACQHTSYTEWKQTIAPTCENDGQRTRYCVKCNVPQNETVAKLGHSYSDEWYIEKQPGCVEAGKKTHRCTRCQAQKDETTIPAKGHSYGSWIVIKEATTSEEGLERRTCSSCGGKEERTIAKQVEGHTHSFSWKVITEATCTNNGVREGTCSCGQTQTEDIAKKGHDYPDSHTIIKDATCTEAGSRAKICRACGTQTDVQVITAKGHSFGTWVVFKAATTESEGEERRYCSVCEHYESKSIAKLVEGHTHAFGGWLVVKEADCTEPGLEMHSCTCGAAETRTITAKGHSFGEWKMIVEPTHESDGYEIRTCIHEKCNEAETRVVDKLPEGADTTTPGTLPSVTPDTSGGEKPGTGKPGGVPSTDKNGIYINLDMETLKYIAIGAGGVFGGMVLVFVIIVINSHRKSRWQ